MRKGTPVSISFSAYDRRTWGPLEIVHRAFLNEVSLLSPGKKPAHPRARVEWIGEPVRREPAGEVIHGGQIIRRWFPATITVR